MQYYRHAKTEIWTQEVQKKASDNARNRHESKQRRLARIKQERAERMARKKRALSSDGGGEDAKKAAIQAALDRVKCKQEQASTTPKNTDNLTVAQQQLIDAADKRRQQHPGSKTTD